MDRLRQRADFLAAASAAKVSTRAFVVQMRDRHERGPARVGFTVSKKVGNAVERNRVRRRLREMVKATAGMAHAGHDYVLIGRRAGLTAPFAGMVEDLKGAFRRLNEGRGKSNGPELRHLKGDGKSA